MIKVILPIIVGLLVAKKIIKMKARKKELCVLPRNNKKKLLIIIDKVVHQGNLLRNIKLARQQL